MKIALGKAPAAGEADTRRIYPHKSIEELSLLDLLTLERESTLLGRPLSIATLDAMEQSVAEAQRGLTGTARTLAAEHHPDAPWLFAVSVWACQRGAGERVSFEDAISIPVNEIAWISEPGDAAAEPDPTRRLPAKSGGGKPRPKDRATKRTSSRASIAD